MVYIIFILLYVYTSYWWLLPNLFTYYSGKKTKKLIDKKLLEFIYKKTGVKLSYITLQESEKPFAYCGNIRPFYPLFVISTKAYKIFTGGSLEWLVLHEMGHYMLFHTVIAVCIELAYVTFGITLLILFTHSTITSILFAVILAIVFGSASIQTRKLLDIWANKYAVRLLDNPEGMADGGRILMDSYAKRNNMHKDTFLRTFFYQWNYGIWNKTIKESEREIKRRKDKVGSNF